MSAEPHGIVWTLGQQTYEARAYLLALMSMLSEERLCAGWIGGNDEYEIWDELNTHPAWSADWIDAHDRERLARLAQECDGWWTWPEPIEQVPRLTGSREGLA